MHMYVVQYIHLLCMRGSYWLTICIIIIINMCTAATTKSLIKQIIIITISQMCVYSKKGGAQKIQCNIHCTLHLCSQYSKQQNSVWFLIFYSTILWCESQTWQREVLDFFSCILTPFNSFDICRIYSFLFFSCICQERNSFQAFFPILYFFSSSCWLDFLIFGWESWQTRTQ